MAPPPGLPSLDILGPTIPSMLELAFSSGVVRGGRPTADQWVTALGELGGNLRKCTANAAHWYYSKFSSCPWCAIEGSSGVPLFPAVFVANAAGTSGMVLLWQQVVAIADPGPLPPIPRPGALTVTASPEARAVGSRRRRRRVTAGVAAALFLVVMSGAMSHGIPYLPMLMAVAAIVSLAFLAARDSAATGFRATAEAVRKDWRELEAAWTRPVAGPSLTSIRKSLDDLKAKHDGLPNERARRLGRLWEARQKSQLSEHLDRFQIADAKISGIGKAKVATLQAHGIFTADDVDPARIYATVIPGFGPATKGKLVDWRRDCESRFRFDPNRGVAQSELDALEREIRQRGTKLEQEVSTGLAQLRAFVANADLRRRTLEGKAAELLPRLAQANADARMVGA